MAQDLYHFGYINTTRELVLWKKGRKSEICRIPLDNALSLMATMTHVLNVEREEANR